MNRRSFLKTLVAVPLAALVLPKAEPRKYNWNTTRVDFYAVMHPKQKEFYDSLLYDNVRYQMYGGAAGGGKSMTYNQLVRSKTPLFRSQR